MTNEVEVRIRGKPHAKVSVGQKVPDKVLREAIAALPDVYAALQGREIKHVSVVRHFGKPVAVNVQA